MNSPMFIWYGLVGLVLLACFIQFVHYLLSSRLAHKHHCNLIGSYREGVILFIPGDKLNEDGDDDDD